MPTKPKQVRAGGTRVQVFNSGNEVWLYDDANLDPIRTPRGKQDLGIGGMPPDFDTKTSEGLIVGYSLLQDDEIDVEVHVGEPFTEKELSVGRWLEPQTAFLKLPSGRLRVEPNDGSRIGPEEPTDKGGEVKVSKGDYLLTLYRVDREALAREGSSWTGAQELIVLTPGGKKSQAASALLPFQDRRDLSWVGKYTIKGRKAAAQVWFGDYWDSFVLNLDATAVTKLGMAPGSYIRTTVPRTGHVLVSAFAGSWEDAKRLPRPDMPLDEYGYAALVNLQEWNGAQAMLCRREQTKTRAEDTDKTAWLDCTVELLDVKPREVTKSERGFSDAVLAEKQFFDPSFLGFVLDEMFPGIDELDEFPLPEAIKRFDKDLGKLKLKSVGDVSWSETSQAGATMEFVARLYTGRDDCFFAVIAHEGNIHPGFFSERADGQWILTGLLDDFQRAIRESESRRPKGAKTTVECAEGDLATVLEAHEAALEDVEVKKAPSTRADAEGALRRFLTTAFPG